MDQLLKFSVARLLTSGLSQASSGTQSLDNETSSKNIDNLLIPATSLQQTQTVANEQPKQSTANVSQNIYDSMILNTLLLLDSNGRQRAANSLINASQQLDTQASPTALRRNFVEFYQPSQSDGASGNSHDRLLLAIADPSTSNSVTNFQASTPLISALGTALWQPPLVGTSPFHAGMMTVDAPPLRPRKAAPRAVFSMLQRRGLERYFQQHKYISRTERRRISATLGLTDVQVKIWFQNRRMKWRQNCSAPETTTENLNAPGDNINNEKDTALKE